MKMRTVVSLVCWALCLPGMCFHFTFAAAAFANLFDFGAWHAHSSDDWWVLLALPPSAAAWLCLAWMNLNWVDDIPVHWAWPVVGTLVALGWLIPYGLPLAMFVFPGVLLATYLCCWHLMIRHRRRRAETSFNQDVLRKTGFFHEIASTKE